MRNAIERAWKCPTMRNVISTIVQSAVFLQPVSEPNIKVYVSLAHG